MCVGTVKREICIGGMSIPRASRDLINHANSRRDSLPRLSGDRHAAELRSAGQRLSLRELLLRDSLENPSCL
jgi:hypothetical protein